jgi:hypothetical protein
MAAAVAPSSSTSSDFCCLSCVSVFSGHTDAVTRSVTCEGRVVQTDTVAQPAKLCSAKMSAARFMRSARGWRRSKRGESDRDKCSVPAGSATSTTPSISLANGYVGRSIVGDAARLPARNCVSRDRVVYCALQRAVWSDGM